VKCSSKIYTTLWFQTHRNIRRICLHACGRPAFPCLWIWTISVSQPDLGRRVLPRRLRCCATFALKKNSIPEELNVKNQQQTSGHRCPVRQKTVVCVDA